MTKPPRTQSTRPFATRAPTFIVVGALLAVSLYLITAPHSPAIAAGSLRSPTQVELVTPSDKAVRLTDNSLTAVDVAPGRPIHIEQVVPGGQEGILTNLASNLPASATLSISDITVTCQSCHPSASGATTWADVSIFDQAQATCSFFAEPTQIAQILSSDNEPSVDFTYPTGHPAPVGIVPKGPWCLGAFVVAPPSTYVVVNVDGATS